MTRRILGLDVGGANLKAATPDGRAVSVPFALWKQPDRLPAALADLVGRFPETTELAVTMTGELCDCYETKRQGVNAILDAVEAAAGGRPVRVWGTGGEFLDVAESRASHMTVAAANWHALATFAARYSADGHPFEGTVLVIDVGSTTTDIVPVRHGRSVSSGRTDVARLACRELVYTGVRRTPVCAVLGADVAAELFATTLDAYLMRGDVADGPLDTDTADGRPATPTHAHARLSRMLGGDGETVSPDVTRRLADRIADRQEELVHAALDAVVARHPGPYRFVLSGAGEFLARRALSDIDYCGCPCDSLAHWIGPDLSACAPAYAVAVLASERPS